MSIWPFRRPVQHTATNAIRAPFPEDKAGYRGSPYTSYGEQVNALSRKFEGTDDWGCQVARNVLDVRSAFIIGQGVQVQAREGQEAEQELEFIRTFMQANNLDNETPQDWAKEAEIEGKILLRLYRRSSKDIAVRFISWTQHGYRVETEPGDYANYTRATYRVDRSGSEQVVDPGEFVFARFGGRTHKVNETPPKLGTVLGNFEALDKAMWDWRKINHLFAAPTPFFKCEDARGVNALKALLDSLNWKIGRLLIANADFSMVGIDSQGIDSLEKEIKINAQIISGSSGVPVHFLGFPELLSNRATADNLLELTSASTNKERSVWAGVYTELFSKALALAGLRSDVIEASIPQVSAAKLAELTTVWLPMFEAGALSLETLLSHVPNIDPAEESQRITDAETEQAAQTVQRLRVLPNIDDGAAA